MKLIYGVGINDAGYVVQKWETLGYKDGKQKQKLLWVCPHYAVWRGMLQRCYSTKCQAKYPSYEGCFVCEEWLTFSTFKSWMETQDWEGKQLDKDILNLFNKLYSPKTCVFITAVLNSFVTESTSIRGDWPIGVSRNNQRFRAHCSNPFTKKREYLGNFLCPEKAHQAWLTRKLELAKLLAAEQDDPRVAKALVERYENYIVEV